MTYASGSISNANSASTFLTTLDATITAVTGLSKVSSAIVVGTNTWNVYKSAGASNSFGTDFYFAIGYPTSTPTSLLMTVFEGWNSGTSLATSYPPNATTTPNGTYANPGSALALPSTGTTMGYLQSATITTAFSYFYSVTVDRVVFSLLTSTPTNIGFYIGLYDSFNTVAVDPFPLCVVNLALAITPGGPITAAPTSLIGLATREPAQSASLGTNFSIGAGSTSSPWTPISASTDAYKGFYYVSRCMLVGRVSAAFRGLLKDIYMGPPQIQNGDLITWTISGTTYTAVRTGASSLGNYVLTI